MSKRGQFFFFIALTLLIAIFEPALTDPCVSKVPVDIKPIRENSKYLIKDNYEGPSEGTLESVENACKEAGLVMPAIDHITDWKSIQELLREYKLNRNETAENNPFAIGAIHDKDKGWVDMETKTVPQFVLWDYDEPEITPETIYMNLAARYFFDEWWIAAADVFYKLGGQAYPVFCQYPRDNKCFKDSQEEKDQKDLEGSGKVDELLDAGKTSDFLWKMNTLPKSYDDSKAMCEKEAGFKLWDGNIKIMEKGKVPVPELLTELQMNVVNHFMTLGVTPWALFYGAPGERAQFTKTTPPEMYIKKADIGKSKLMALCIGTDIPTTTTTELTTTTTDIPTTTTTELTTTTKVSDPCGLKVPADIKPIRLNSKYLMKDKYEGPSGGTLESVENACKEAGLVMPAIDHITDWKSIQELLREYKLNRNETAENNPFAIGAIHDKDKGWVDMETKTVPQFALWDYGEPDITPETIYMNLAARYFMDEWWIAAADVFYKLGGQAYPVFCQYPRNNKCFKDSQEEKDQKDLEGSGKVDELVDAGETADFLWKMNTLPKSYDDSKAMCEKEEGFKLWDGNTKIMEKREFTVPEQLKELQALVTNHFMTQGVTPWALFYGAPGERAQFTKADPPEMYIKKAELGKSKLMALCIYDFPEHCDPP